MVHDRSRQLEEDEPHLPNLSSVTASGEFLLMFFFHRKTSSNLDTYAVLFEYCVVIRIFDDYTKKTTKVGLQKNLLRALWTVDLYSANTPPPPSPPSPAPRL
jgi:hypothetical protein